jgi:nucleotide-binding universal stress UspA family protein
MLCSKMLVAYDRSALAQKSLEKALEIAKTDPAIAIEVVHVVTLPVLFDTVIDNFHILEDAVYQEGKEVIAQAKPALSVLPNPCRFYLLEGSPAYVILAHAKEHQCDLIVMGSRGLSGIKEFLGSVSRTVVQSSPVPVLIIK